MDNKAALAQQIDDAKTEEKAEGRIEGEAIGVEKGKIELAKRLLQNGIDLIAESSDLSREQIESLKKYIFDETSGVNF